MSKPESHPDAPAFPFVEPPEPGLNTREYFAIKALQGLLANGYSSNHAASAAVDYADKLIAELNK